MHDKIVIDQVTGLTLQSSSFRNQYDTTGQRKAGKEIQGQRRFHRISKDTICSKVSPPAYVQVRSDTCMFKTF